MRSAARRVNYMEVIHNLTWGNAVHADVWLAVGNFGPGNNHVCLRGAATSRVCRTGR